MTKKRQKRRQPLKRYSTVRVVSSVTDARQELLGSDSLVLVERAVPRSVWLRCPCGCNSILNINVDERINPHWHLRRYDQTLTLIPSVWRESDCHAHFILWENEILMCGVGRSLRFTTEDAIRRYIGRE
jgi:hypothetical protein